MKKNFWFSIALLCAYAVLRANEAPMIGVYSGSFDPPTTAHYKIIMAALEEQKLNKLVLYVNQYGKKPYRAKVEERKKMLETMLGDKNNLISVFIQTNADKRIDYRTIREPGCKLALIIGEDSYFKRLELPEIQKIPTDKIIIIPRASDSMGLKEVVGPEVQIMHITGIDGISSTRAYQQLQLGDYSNVEITESVLKYILENRLYLPRQE